MKRKISKRKKTISGWNGKVSAAMVFILLLVMVVGVFLTAGNIQFSPTQEQVTVNSYTCCDSGDGEACTTNPAVKLFLNGTVAYSGVTATYANEEYQLLKSNVKLREVWGHLWPVPPEVVSGLPAGQFVYINTTDQPWGGRSPYTKEEECSKGDTTLDQLFKGGGGCEPVPNDQVIYVCASGCSANQQYGEQAILNVYFRARDLPKIPDVIRFCVKPEETDVEQGAQRLTNVTQSPGFKNLQLETFYITNETVINDWVSPYCKPAIYLYPEEKTYVNVKVASKGKLTYTIPEYPELGWNVFAYPDGSIYHNLSKYEYLYYETEVQEEDLQLPEEGYVVAYKDFPTFLPDFVAELGLNPQETKDFSDYWLGVLPDAPYYQVKVVAEETLHDLARLNISPLPTTLIRVTLHFEALDEYKELAAPTIAPVQRDGFTVVEWGGIFKKYKDRPFSCLM